MLQGLAREREGTGQTGGNCGRMAQWLKQISINTPARTASGSAKCQCPHFFIPPNLAYYLVIRGYARVDSVAPFPRKRAALSQAL